MFHCITSISSPFPRGTDSDILQPVHIVCIVYLNEHCNLINRVNNQIEVTVCKLLTWPAVTWWEIMRFVWYESESMGPAGEILAAPQNETLSRFSFHLLVSIWNYFVFTSKKCFFYPPLLAMLLKKGKTTCFCSPLSFFVACLPMCLHGSCNNQSSVFGSKLQCPWELNTLRLKKTDAKQTKHKEMNNTFSQIWQPMCSI